MGKIFVTIDAESVLREARASDARYDNGEVLGVWDGVPIAIKDMIAVKGLPMSDGTKAPDPCPPGWDAQPGCSISTVDDVLVARFRSLGAIILGTTVMTEFGTTPLGWSAHFQGPRNAYNEGFYPGGSSSGSAVAVAAGLVPVAVGFDGGGSIRIPAALSGVVGLAASYGRIATDDHQGSTMIKCGPLAGSVRDAAHAYLAMGEPVEKHAFSLDHGEQGLPPAHVEGFEDVDDLKGLRLGIFKDHFNDGDPEIVEAVKKVIDDLTNRGAEVVEIEIPHLRSLSLAHGIYIASEFALGQEWKYQNGWNLEPNTRITLGIGKTVTATEALSANKLRGWAREYLRDLFEKHHLTSIVSPTTGSVAPKLEADAEAYGESNTAGIMKLMTHIFMANFLGLPSLSVPVGR